MQQTSPVLKTAALMDGRSGGGVRLLHLQLLCAVSRVKMERKFRISQLIDILNFTLSCAPPDPAENNLIAKQIKIAKLKFKAQKFKSLDEVK